MLRKTRTPEEKARWKKIRELLRVSNMGSKEDIQDLFKETIAEFMENGLDPELDEELGYSKYDYKNKDTGNSRNGRSSKRLRTSYGDIEISTPRDRNGEFEPQLLKKNQTSISQDVEEKILSMYAKEMTIRISRGWLPLGFWPFYTNTPLCRSDSGGITLNHLYLTDGYCTLSWMRVECVRVQIRSRSAAFQGGLRRCGARTP